MIKHYLSTALCAALLILILHDTTAQTVTVPRVSQQAVVSQRVGITDISITYHSPAVKGRKVWGALVPFDQVWRAGANENTLISFTHDVKVEGQNISAGTYGLYMMVRENSVDVIFSRATKNWGTVVPTPDETVLTVSVSPEIGPHQEWLSFDFQDRGGNDVTAALKWEKWVIPFNISVDVPTIVLDNIRAELKGLPGFGYLGREQAARFCMNNDIALHDAMTWIDGSIRAVKRFSNLAVKAGLLRKSGKTEEAEKLMEEALGLAQPAQVNVYGYQLMNSGDVEGAVKVFLGNIESCPKSHPFYWGFVDSVGEAYLKMGDKKKAIKYYTLAKEYAPDNRQGYLDGVIKGIKEKK